MKEAYHATLTAGRWHTLTLAEQLANVGSEFSRALRAHQAHNQPRFENALNRFLELINLTLTDSRWRDYRKREIARLKEVVLGGFFDSDNEKGLLGLESYFTYFGVVARKQ